jgi:vacuolar protein sorting-associated protein 26
LLLRADADKRLRSIVKDEYGVDQELLLFSGNESVSGQVTVSVPAGKKFEHLGIKLELIGQIELYNDRSNPTEFQSLVRVLEEGGELSSNKTYDFEFKNVDKQHETYSGINTRLRWFLRAKITRQYGSNITKTLDFAVQRLKPEPEFNSLIKMEVGIEDCLHIEFEYSKSKYHIKDMIIGKIYFLLVRIKIKHMEVVIIKRESTGSGSNTYNESENITKYEIMDGAPVRGESIPIRLYLSPYNLTPTFRNIHNKFSVKYYLNLVLVDEEDRRYFKQQEIELWRNELTTVKGSGTTQTQ